MGRDAQLTNQASAHDMGLALHSGKSSREV